MNSCFLPLPVSPQLHDIFNAYEISSYIPDPDSKTATLPINKGPAQSPFLPKKRHSTKKSLGRRQSPKKSLGRKKSTKKSLGRKRQQVKK